MISVVEIEVSAKKFCRGWLLFTVFPLECLLPSFGLGGYVSQRYLMPAKHLQVQKHTWVNRFVCGLFFYLVIAKNASSRCKLYCGKTATLILFLLNKIILYFYEFFQYISVT